MFHPAVLLCPLVAIKLIYILQILNLIISKNITSINYFIISNTFMTNINY